MLTKLYHWGRGWGLTFKTVKRNLFKEKFEPETALLHRYVHSGDTVIDIGAAYGRYAIHLSRLGGGTGRVICLEPGDFSRTVLRRAKAFHRLNNVTIRCEAVAERTGEMFLNIPVKTGGRHGNSLAFLSDHAHEDCIAQPGVRTITVDELCRQENIKKVDFIKCDVEGGEYAALKGAEKTIGRDKPVILCELDAAFTERNQTNNAGPQESFSFLKNNGYRSFIYSETQNDFIVCESIDKGGNYLFLPLKKPGQEMTGGRAELQEERTV